MSRFFFFFFDAGKKYGYETTLNAVGSRELRECRQTSPHGLLCLAQAFLASWIQRRVATYRPDPAGRHRRKMRACVSLDRRPSVTLHRRSFSPLAGTLPAALARSGQ